MAKYDNIFKSVICEYDNSCTTNKVRCVSCLRNKLVVIPKDFYNINPQDNSKFKKLINYYNVFKSVICECEGSCTTNKVRCVSCLRNKLVVIPKDFYNINPQDNSKFKKLINYDY